jgi:Domain of unknown function (DUF4340)
MKAGGLFTALGVLVVLGGLVWWSNKHPSVPATTTPPAPKLISVDQKQIDGIRIVKPGDEPIELAKLAGTWQIAKPMPLSADQDAVGMLTGSLATLNADRLIDEHPANLNDFGLASPALEVDVSEGSKTQKLLIGSDTPAATGTYAKIESDPKVYTVPSFLKTSLTKTVADLRDKRLLTFNQDKLKSVALANKGTVEFGKNSQGDWQITKPKPMRADSLTVDDLVRQLKDAKLDLTSADSDSKAAAEQYNGGEKVGTATVTDNTGTQTLDIHKGKNNSFYAKSSVVAGIYKVAGDIGTSIGKTLDDFRNKKLFDFGFNDPTKVEINGMAYQKSGDKWTSGSMQYDAGSMQTVIDKLRDLSATKFSDKMAGTQVLTLTVTSGDNHRYEKVTLNKDGDVYDAQRDGEPGTVYIVDAKSFDDLQKAISGIKPSKPPGSGKK